VIPPCGDVHQSFTDTRKDVVMPYLWFIFLWIHQYRDGVKVFRQLLMFANSFSVLSIHCVARGLGATFLYKCFTSRGVCPATERPSCMSCQSQSRNLIQNYFYLLTGAQSGHVCGYHDNGGENGCECR